MSIKLKKIKIPPDFNPRFCVIIFVLSTKVGKISYLCIDPLRFVLHNYQQHHWGSEYIQCHLGSRFLQEKILQSNSMPVWSIEYLIEMVWYMLLSINLPRYFEYQSNQKYQKCSSITKPSEIETQVQDSLDRVSFEWDFGMITGCKTLLRVSLTSWTIPAISHCVCFIRLNPYLSRITF